MRWLCDRAPWRAQMHEKRLLAWLLIFWRRPRKRRVGGPPEGSVSSERRTMRFELPIIAASSVAMAAAGLYYATVAVRSQCLGPTGRAAPTDPHPLPSPPHTAPP